MHFSSPTSLLSGLLFMQTASVLGLQKPDVWSDSLVAEAGSGCIAVTYTSTGSWTWTPSPLFTTPESWGAWDGISTSLRASSGLASTVQVAWPSSESSPGSPIDL